MDAPKGKKGKPPKILDLNILPARYRRRRLSLRTIRLWTLMLGFAGLIYPSYMIYHKADVALKQQERRLKRIQNVLDEYEPLVEEKDALAAQIEEVVEQSREIEAVAESAVIQETVWSDLLQIIVDTVPDGIELTSIIQADDEVRIVGLTGSRRLPPSLVDALSETALFIDVYIEYMVKQVPEVEEGEIVVFTTPELQYEFEIRLDLGGEIEEPDEDM